ncbi:L,D-transpeptidase family protein [Sphingomicrobium astaxanthinifaciens]|uniref:L,D-transpeptidase family protein n=1 Tax=Sphingomicrobium astaxanthinifaciens TaxID=1227949 RepID=UPI001FCAC9A0|nr:L,D-transpeptidase family protein [Sphingomicrobium astaxanthinifaciens]MCJ7421831.1 L,D-transpeptidase family protein [Sphingomicrobium astaxanthinifaciens]
MKTLALSLAVAALATTSPVLASTNNSNSNDGAPVATGSLAAFSFDAASPERIFSYDGIEYEYSKADVTLRGDVAGGTNTLEGYAARAEAAKQAEAAYRDMQEKFGVDAIAPNRFKWDAKGASGEPRVVISLSRQLAFVYLGDTLVGAASVTTARDNKLTPQGIFPVWLKKPMHYSKAYENTPMPYTQFIDEHGIALHAGPNPGYPASAGCVRLPSQFAKNLYALTSLGTTVMIGA